MNYNHDKDVKVFFGEKFNDSGFPISETSGLFEGRFFSLCKKIKEISRQVLELADFRENFQWPHG